MNSSLIACSGSCRGCNRYVAPLYLHGRQLLCRSCLGSVPFEGDVLIQENQVLSRKVSKVQRHIAVGIAVFIAGLMGRSGVVEYNKVQEAKEVAQKERLTDAARTVHAVPEDWTKLGDNHAYRNSDVSVCIVRYVPGGVEVVDYIVKEK